MPLHPVNMLASRSGLDSAEEPMSEIAAKIAELVAPSALLANG